MADEFPRRENIHPVPGIGLLEGMITARSARNNQLLERLEATNARLTSRIPAHRHNEEFTAAMENTLQPSHLDDVGVHEPLHRLRRINASTLPNGRPIIHGH